MIKGRLVYTVNKSCRIARDIESLGVEEAWVHTRVLTVLLVCLGG